MELIQKQYVSFEQMENEPSENLMPFVWDLVNEIRNQLNLVYDDAHSKAVKVESERNRLQAKLLEKYKSQGMTEEAAKEEIKKLLNIGGVESRIWVDANGEIRTNTTYAKKKR